jgi:hypothetical protein
MYYRFCYIEGSSAVGHDHGRWGMW